MQQPEPGTVLWLSPLGGRYEVQPEPVLPALPDTCPASDDPQHDEAAPPGQEMLIMYGPDPPPTPGEPEPVDLDASPPF